MITSQDLNSFDKVVGDQAADTLRLQVVGVVIAVRQHIGADQDAPLDLGAEALGAGLLYMSSIAVFRRPIP